MTRKKKKTRKVLLSMGEQKQKNTLSSLIYIVGVMALCYFIAGLI